MNLDGVAVDHGGDSNNAFLCDARTVAVQGAQRSVIKPIVAAIFMLNLYWPAGLI